MADQIFLVNSASFDILTVTASIVVSQNAIVDFSLASTVTGSFSGQASGLTGVTASYIVPDSDVTSSWANTASWAINAVNGGTQIITASTLPVTSSWSEQSISSSYSPVEPDYSSSISSQFETKQNTLVTGQTYTITSSWAVSSSWVPNLYPQTEQVSASYASRSLSASYSPVDPAYSASITTQLDSKQPTLVVGGVYTITSSWAQTASVALNATPTVSSSWASSSLSASFIVPGATLYLVSGSDGIPPAYIEPYDYSTTGSELYRPPFKEGRLMWDHKYVDYSHYMDTNWRIHLGKEVCIGVHNPTALTMSRLTPVYISGSSEAGAYRPDVYPAMADGTGLKSDVIGVVRAPINPGGNGFILMMGEMHNNDMGSYGAVGTELWLSPTGGLTVTKPGQPNEVVKVGYVSEAGSVGSFVADIETEPVPANAYAGMTNIPSIADAYPASEDVMIGSGSVNLYNNASGVGAITQYPVNEATFSVPAGFDAFFVYATTNGATASYEITTDFNNINGTSKVLVTTLYRADEDAHWMESKEEGLALANKINIRLLETEKFKWESGFTLLSTGSNYYTITEGSVWFGATNLTQQEFNSFDTASVSPKFETHWAYHSASAWLIPTQSNGQWNSGYYDDGTNLVALGPASWSCHYVYRILGENPFDEDVFLVTSNYQYGSYAEAQADSLPAGIPPVLDDVAIMVGRLVFESGSTTATPESAFTSNFGQSTVTQHNSLGGLQGGAGGQYYHLTSADYTGTGAGVIVRASNASMDETTITNAHLTGSLQGTSSWANKAVSADSATTSNFATSATSASYASSSTSASYAPVEPVYSASVSTQFSTKQNTLVTAATYTITSSWSEKSTSSSYAPVEPNYSSSVSTQFGTKQDSLVTGTTYNITSSWAEKATSASYAPVEIGYSSSVASQFSTKQDTLVTGQTYTITSSWSERAVSASYAPSSEAGTTLFTGSTYEITSSWAVSASWAPGGQGSGTTLFTGSTYEITASWAVSASWAPGGESTATTLYTASTYEITSSWAVSASWAPGGVGPAESASWASSSISASYAPVEPDYSASVSTIFGTKQDTLVVGNTYTITSSWAENAVSASYAPQTSTNTFSRGGTFHDPYGLGGMAASSQSVVIWRAPFACTATSVRGYMVSTTAGTTVSVTARKNGSLLLTLPLVLSASATWIGPGGVLQNNSFAIGDTLDIFLITASNTTVTQSAIQIDFTRP